MKSSQDSFDPLESSRMPGIYKLISSALSSSDKARSTPDRTRIWTGGAQPSKIGKLNRGSISLCEAVQEF